MASYDQVQSSSLYESPILPKKSNVRIVENRVVINAPHKVVFDFVTTWANLGLWLPMTDTTTVLKGKNGTPAEVGDVLYEGVKENFDMHPKVYTVMAKIPGVLWVLAGTNQNDSWVRWVAHFSTTPLEGNKTLFCRVFQQNCRDSSEPTHAVTDPAICQVAVEALRTAVEEHVERS